MSLRGRIWRAGFPPRPAPASGRPRLQEGDVLTAPQGPNHSSPTGLFTLEILWGKKKKEKVVMPFCLQGVTSPRKFVAKCEAGNFKMGGALTLAAARYWIPTPLNSNTTSSLASLPARQALPLLLLLLLLRACLRPRPAPLAESIRRGCQHNAIIARHTIQTSLTRSARGPGPRALFCVALPIISYRGRRPLLLLPCTPAVVLPIT